MNTLALIVSMCSAAVVLRRWKRRNDKVQESAGIGAGKRPGHCGPFKTEVQGIDYDAL